jgi:hypothetical protein
MRQVLKKRERCVRGKTPLLTVTLPRAEDIGRLEDYKLEARMRHQRLEDLVKDKKKRFFTIWANMSEVSLQKVKEHLTVSTASC